MDPAAGLWNPGSFHTFANQVLWEQVVLETYVSGHHVITHVVPETRCDLRVTTAFLPDSTQPFQNFVGLISEGFKLKGKWRLQVLGKSKLLARFFEIGARCTT